MTFSTIAETTKHTHVEYIKFYESRILVMFGIFSNRSCTHKTFLFYVKLNRKNQDWKYDDSWINDITVFEISIKLISYANK